MKLAVDLHIHSCLSPCGDELMTPGNIVGMASLKELDAIAITDHNRALNLPAAECHAKEMGILLVPGLEVQSREEVHLLCYFPSVEQALAFDSELYETFLPLPNREDIFGRQQILDNEDEEVGIEERLLLQSSSWSIDQVMENAALHDGVVVPSHINRSSNSLIASLGFIPFDAGFTAFEVYKNAPSPEIDLSGYTVTYSSDAHYIENMLEREFFLNVKEKSVQAIIDKLKRL